MVGKESKIVIIGAGISGIACAVRLKNNGYKNIVILEATNRTGGRIDTYHSGSSIFECGAQFIHGQDDNPLYDIIKSIKKEKNISIYESYEVSCAHDFCCSLTDQKYISEVCEVFDSAENDTCKMDLIDHHFPNDKSMGDYLMKKFQEHMEDETDPNIIDLKNSVSDWHVRYSIESNASDPMSILSLPRYKVYQEFDGIPYTEFDCGFDSIIEYLIAELNLDDIKLNSCVTKIDWSNDKINVNSRDESYEADHVVVTIPLGALKKDHNELFFPTLPKNKVVAIESLGFGTVDKIFFRFEKPFWKDCYRTDGIATSYNILWKDGLNYQGRNYLDGYTESLDQKDMPNIWFRYIVRICTIIGDDHTLCAWIFGDGAKYAENLPEEVIVHKIRAILMSKFGISDLELPKLVTQSKWASNSYTRGSYSFLSVDCDENQCSNRDLASPITSNMSGKQVPVIMFAGEATHENMFSTAHGALLTGQREANRIINFYNSTD